MIFGVDDGPKTLEMSLSLAEASIAEGVTHVVCTPHASHAHKFQPEVNQERLAILKERLRGRLSLGLGSDFHLTYDNIEDATRDRATYTINSGRYLLVEAARIRNLSNKLEGVVSIQRDRDCSNHYPSGA